MITQEGLVQERLVVADQTNTWSDERVERLRALFADGLSASQIGAELGCSRNAIIGKSHRLGLSRPQNPSSAPKKSRGQNNGSLGATTERLINARTHSRSAPPVLPQLSKHVAGNKTIFELRHDDCRWLVGEMERGQHMFCGNRVIIGKAYCPEHWNMVYVKPRVR